MKSSLTRVLGVAVLFFSLCSACGKSETGSAGPSAPAVSAAPVVSTPPTTPPNPQVNLQANARAMAAYENYRATSTSTDLPAAFTMRSADGLRAVTCLGERHSDNGAAGRQAAQGTAEVLETLGEPVFVEGSDPYEGRNNQEFARSMSNLQNCRSGNPGIICHAARNVRNIRSLELAPETDAHRQYRYLLRNFRENDREWSRAFDRILAIVDTERETEMSRVLHEAEFQGHAWAVTGANHGEGLRNRLEQRGWTLLTPQ